MSTFLLGTALVAIVVAATPVAERLRVPLPVLLTVCGLAIPLIPGTPTLDIEPDLILPIVLPPLLFAATQRATAQEFRVNARPILLLAVGLTVATTAAVAAAAHAAGFGWGPAVVLGAVVAPPDPVAATAVARRLNLPQRLVTVLEGEGMFNDATALVLYSVSVTAVVTSSVTTLGVAWRLVLAVVGGILLGLLAGGLARLALRWLHDAAAETTVTIALPFAVYVVAEHVHSSGVLAVLTLGLFLRTYGHPVLTSQGWLLGRAVWHFADYVITSLVFLLIGFELTAVLRNYDIASDTFVLGGIVAVLLVGVRFAWMFPGLALAKAMHRRDEEAVPDNRREILVAAWAGMRGVVTVATALALPLSTRAGSGFPHRSDIVVIALGCVLLTLVAQGLTLAPLVTRLKVGSDANVGREVVQLRRRAANEALRAVRDAADDGEVAEEIARAATLQYEGFIAAQEAIHMPGQDGESWDDEQAEQLSSLLRRASEVERSVVLEARRSGSVSAQAADDVLSDVESRAVRDFG